MELREIPIRINWFAKPTRIAEALGLNVVLPDLEIEDSGYWECFDRDAWRKELRGKVAMTDEELRRIDADWVRLEQFGQYAEVWFDIEEGIVIRCTAADAGRVVELIRALAACHEIPLNAEDEPLVTAMQSIAGGDIPWGEALLEVSDQQGSSGTGSTGSSRFARITVALTTLVLANDVAVLLFAERHHAEASLAYER